jgi:amino acid adenylation domain-containing protein
MASTDSARLSGLLTPGPGADALGIPLALPLPGPSTADHPVYLASWSQTRLWFLHQLDPGLTAYHLPALWRLRGPLDLAALQAAFEALLERHPALRTSFQIQGEEVVQRLHPAGFAALSPEPLGPRTQEQAIAHWLEAERRAPLALSSGTLLRARLLQLGEDDHLLLINHHHIASDGWSVSVMRRDLCALYNAHRAGRPASLPPLTIQPHDHAVWQRTRLQGQTLERLLTYWIPALEGLPPLELPADRPRPAGPGHRGGTLALEIPSSQALAFTALCRREGATLQMGLLALVWVLLQRWSRQQDFAIGVPIWGRHAPGSRRRAARPLLGLIGCFVNTLPIRLRSDGAEGFRELLHQVRATATAAYDHAELPFERMVEVLQPERDPGRNPLVQVMLQLRDLPAASLEAMDGLVVERLPWPEEPAQFDLSFTFQRTPEDGLSGTLLYSRDLFDGERLERLAQQLLTLLQSVLDDPDGPLRALELLPAAERRQISGWQDGPVPEGIDAGIHERFARQVLRTPQAVALVTAAGPVSYAGLADRAEGLCQRLLERGVGPEDLVAVALERSPELIAALLAILRAGAAYLPLDPHWPWPRQEALLRQARCTRLIGAGPLPEQAEGWTLAPLAVDGLASLLWHTAGSALPAPLPPSQAGERAAGDRLAYVAFTSGSTGVPKGVAVPHRGVLRLIDPVNGFLLGPGARVLQLAPVAFDAATFEIWGPLLNGGTLVLAPPGLPTLAGLAALLRRQAITTLWLTAGLFHAMVDEELEALAGVRQLLAGGDVLPPGPVRRLLAAMPPGSELFNGYGPTENTTFTCCHRLVAPAGWDGPSVPIGRPIAATQVRVLDPDGRPCPIGVPGELHIGGAGLARGYLHQPELTAAAFLPDPAARVAGARLYRSGDLVSWTAAGTLAFHGRLDGQIKLRGFRIEPAEIEAQLLAHPAVAQVAVVLVQDAPASSRLVAYWVPAAPGRPGPASDRAAELRRFLVERLPDVMVPALLIALEALPLNANGKLDRRALPAPAPEGDPGRVAPRSEPERRLHALWAELLGHTDFGVTDNFFQVGGHSLAATRLIARLEDGWGVSLPIATLFHAPTVAQLAEVLQSAGSEPATAAAPAVDPCLLPLRPGGGAPPLFVVHGYAGDVFCYTAFAHALAPGRAVHGLQALGFDGSAPRQDSVEAMAALYAERILDLQPTGPYHLLGQSAGGWYAWAVADALLQRGGRIGLLAILDSAPSAAISRRLRAALLARRTLRRLPAYGGLLLRELRRLLLQQESADPHGRVRRARSRRLRRELRWFRRPALPLAEALRRAEAGEGDYFALLHQTYRPQPLPLHVHLFTTGVEVAVKKRLWQAYARGGISYRRLFDAHYQYHSEPWAAELAEAIDACLDQIEAG